MNLNIEKSTKINSTRLTKMKERNECILNVKREAKDHLLKSVVSPEKFAYKQAMKSLIVQGMIKLIEPDVLLKVRKEDLNLVKELVPECE